MLYAFKFRMMDFKKGTLVVYKNEECTITRVAYHLCNLLPVKYSYLHSVAKLPFIEYGVELKELIVCKD